MAPTEGRVAMPERWWECHKAGDRDVVSFTLEGTREDHRLTTL